MRDGTVAMYLLIDILLSVISYCHCYGQANPHTFYYFAYGSNMLDRRIHLRNPTAEFYSPAVLKGYRLDFNLYVPSWRGAAATIVTDPGSSVWGAVWIIERKQMYRLDEQEGVHLRWYVPINVTVTTPQGRDLIARTYREIILLPKLSEGETLPPARRPSNTYLQVMILGAYEAGLPPQYIGYLHTFPTNGRIADSHIRNKLGYPFNVSL
ncbi:PREDICTED: gamma-glutamylcyclotransferase-like [Papilio polytes]|uniref:gamma-glutamylcyclotransferase-like n=1 Tax=Papilio polytes TaxID=76194 RepID=UPI000675BB1D|nr:PREDICTED: gamma-glutamylcyclotransferase-like [Papilio polytes]